MTIEDIKKLLKYQELDMQYVKIMNELAATIEYKQLNNAKNKIKLANDAIMKLGKEAGDIMANFSAYETSVNDLNNETKDIKEITKNNDNIQELDNHIKKLESIYSNMEKINSKLNNMLNNTNALNAEFKQVMQEGRVFSKEAKELEEPFMKIKNEREDEVNKIRMQQKKLEGTIAEDAMNVYNRLKKANKMPCIVPYNTANNGCSRCGMELDISLRNKIKNTKFVECQTCNRIIYDNLD